MRTLFTDRIRLHAFHRFLTCLLLAMMMIMADSAAAQNRNAVETMNFDQTMEIDDLGLATITIKMTFTAAQFQQWQSKYGSNKSLLKRDMNKFISQYDTFDWDVSEKQMDREITVRLRARGAVMHKGRGVHEFRVPKEWRGGERRDNVFTFNYVEGIAPGVVGQFNVRLIAPRNASGFKEQLAESGEKVIQYAMPVPDGRQGWMLAAGAVATVIGLGLVGLAFVGGGSSKASTAKSTSRSAHSTSTHAPARAPAKKIDPPSMSVIPLEETNTGTFVDDRKGNRSK